MTLSMRSRGRNGRPPTAVRTTAVRATAVRTVAAAFAVTATLTVIWASPDASASDQLVPARAAAASSYQGPVKYYIVQAPRNGHKEFLYEIAAKTLGDGNRALTIFELNKGRLQPDGRRLESATVILPGWILVLPADASGPGVRFGLLPKATPQARASASTSASASARPSASPSAGHRRFLPVVPPKSAAGHSAQSEPAFGLWIRRHEMIIGGSAVVIVGVGLAVRRRKRRRSRDPWEPGQPGDPDSLEDGGYPELPAPPADEYGSEGDVLSWLKELKTAEAKDSQATPDPTPPSSAPAAPTPARPAPATPAWATAAPATPARATAAPAMPTRATATSVTLPPAAPAQATSAPITPTRVTLPPAASARATSAPVTPTRVTLLPVTPAQATPPPVTPAPVPSAGTDMADLQWPDYLLPGAGEPNVTEPYAADPLGVDSRSRRLAAVGHETASTGTAGTPAAGPAVSRTEPAATDGTQPLVFSPVALRLLGAQRSSAHLAESAHVSAQALEVALGDDKIRVVLAETPVPAAHHEGRPRSSHSWLASAPYLVWAPLPYDIPQNGNAFACLGAGDEGCLFIDLAAAPGAVAIGGDDGAAARLAESIAYQLCAASAPRSTCSVVVVGEALPQPCPSGAAWIASLDDCDASAPLARGAALATEIVFCKLESNEDAFALARYVSSSKHRVVPVILANLPEAPWSFMAQPCRHPDGVLNPVIA